MGPSGFIALLAGWTVTEVGRQPFTVYGLLRTSDSASPVGLPGVAVSLAAIRCCLPASCLAPAFLCASPAAAAADRRGDRAAAGLPVRGAGITPGRRDWPPPHRTMGAGMMLSLVWAGLIAFAVLAYVLLDGFDLGVGVCSPSSGATPDRDVMLNSIAPIWDGNETWLVLGGGGLLAVFPLAYAVILPALYPAIIAMLLALVFRGVGFEFRFRAATPRGRLWWDAAFWSAPRWRHSARGWCWAGCCRASVWRTACTPAAGGTGSPGSPWYAVSPSLSATRCRAPAG